MVFIKINKNLFLARKLQIFPQISYYILCTISNLHLLCSAGESNPLSIPVSRPTKGSLHI